MGTPWHSTFEEILVFTKGDKFRIDRVALGKHGRNRCNVWEYAGATQTLEFLLWRWRRFTRSALPMGDPRIIFEPSARCFRGYDKLTEGNPPRGLFNGRSASFKPTLAQSILLRSFRPLPSPTMSFTTITTGIHNLFTRIAYLHPNGRWLRRSPPPAVRGCKLPLFTTPI